MSIHCCGSRRCRLLSAPHPIGSTRTIISRRRTTRTSINAAFQLPDRKTRELYERAYEAGSALYYQGKPSFTEILAALDQWKDRL
jgi:hypothetical protein